LDDLDLTTERQEKLDTMALASVHEAVRQIPTGHEGVCDKCGNEHVRLMGADSFDSKRLYVVAAGVIDGICPPCRDKFKLP